MITFTWNSSFESRPGAGLNRNALDNELRLISLGIRERMEREHNWGPYTDADDGTHIPGKTTVLGIGSYANRTSYSNPQEGALYVAQDEGESGNMQVYIYYSSEWHKISDLDHGSLSNLTDVGAHTIYLLKTGGTIDGKLDLSSNALILSDYSDGIGSGLVVGQHMGRSHVLDDQSAVADDTIPLAKVNIGQVSDSGILEPLRAELVSTKECFCPNFYSPNAYQLYLSSGGSPTGGEIRGIYVYNLSFADSGSYRMNLTYIDGD